MSSKAIGIGTLTLSVLLIFTVSFVSSAGYKDKFILTFETTSSPTHVCIDIGITNPEESDDLPFKSILNNTNINVTSADIRFYEWMENIDELNVTDYCNNLTESGNGSDINLPYPCGSHSDYIDQSYWRKEVLFESTEDGEKGEISTEFEDISVITNITRNFRICYDFGSAMTQSYGYMYIESGDNLFFDFDNSSWWNVSWANKLPFRGKTSSGSVSDLPILLSNSTYNNNMIIGSSTETMWFWNTTVNETWRDLSYPYSNDETDISVIDFTDTYQVGTLVEDGNSSSYGSPPSDITLWITYNDSLDHSVNGLTITENNFDGNESIQGEIGYGYDLDIDNDFMTVSSHPAWNDFTICSWTYTPAGYKADSNIHSIISKYNAYAWGGGIDTMIRLMDTGSDGIWYIGDAGAGNYVSISWSENNITEEVWEYWCFVADEANNMSVYKNGSLIALKTISANFDAGTENFYVGMENNVESGLSYDNTMTWNRILTSDEIQFMYENQASTFNATQFSSSEVQSSSDSFYSITLFRPDNTTTISDNTPELGFGYNGTYATAICDAWIDSSHVGRNTTTVNNTNTYIISNTTLGEGIHDWFVNCTNSTDYIQDTTAEFTVDTTPPDIFISTPTNTTYTINPMSLNFQISDDYPESYSWYSLNSGTNISTIEEYGTYIQSHVLSSDLFSNTLGAPKATTSNSTHLFITRSLANSEVGAVVIYEKDDSGITYSSYFNTTASGLMHPYSISYNNEELYMTNGTGIELDSNIYIYHINGTYKTKYTVGYNTITACTVDGEDYIYVIDIAATTKIKEHWLNNGSATGTEYTIPAKTYTSFSCDDTYFYTALLSSSTYNRTYRNGTAADEVTLTQTAGSVDIHTDNTYIWTTDDVAGGSPYSLDVYYDNAHVNTTFTALQGSNTIVMYANDSFNNLNSTTVNFYVDTLSPKITSPTTSPTTCLPNPGAVRLSWTQSDNLDDLTVICNFTNSTGTTFSQNALIQTANSTSSCSRLLDTIGQWAITLYVTDLSGNQVNYTSAVEVRDDCGTSVPPGDGGSSSITHPEVVDTIIITPSCTDGYEYNPSTGRCTSTTISPEDLTPLQQVELGLVTPSLFQVGFDINSTDEQGNVYTLQHTTFLLSTLNLILIIVTVSYLYFARRRYNKFRNIDIVLGLSMAAFIVLSISTAFPPEIWAAIANRGSFVPITDPLFPQPSDSTPQVTTELPPNPTAELGPTLWEQLQSNYMAVIGIVVLAIGLYYLYKNEKKTNKLVKSIRRSL